MKILKWYAMGLYVGKITVQALAIYAYGKEGMKTEKLASFIYGVLVYLPVFFYLLNS